MLRLLSAPAVGSRRPRHHGSLGENCDKSTPVTLMKVEKDKDALRITNQCRVTGGMTYGLKCEGVLLTLVVSPRASEHDEGEWRVEAKAKRATDEPFLAAEWGPTRIEALRAVGRAWDANVPRHGLGMFDWEAVARVLQEVRAV